MTIFPKETKFDYLKPTIINIIKLAKEKKQENNSKGEQDFAETVLLGRQGKSKELYDYLLGLEEKDLQKILAIMYIGRDVFGHEDISYGGFDNYMEGFNHIYKEGQNIVANQIAQKVPLDEYLYNGCKYLNIDL